jgi:S-adenosylmethionine:tRNA ribosyltransferase-isomerase
MKKRDTIIDLNSYKYSLPESRIARYPLPRRSDSKLLVYERGGISHKGFSELPSILEEGSSLVFNNTRVIQARLTFRKSTGARIEIFCLEPLDPSDYQLAFQSKGQSSWLCLVGNARKWKSGPVFMDLSLGDQQLRLEATLKQRKEEGFEVLFQWQNPEVSFGEIIENSGSTPIPPYLNREAELSDKERYQTVYSRNDGSVAAPTAGLHFTPELLSQLDKRGIRQDHITLHVGAGTFVPVKEQNARDHSMHSEMVLVKKSFIEKWKQETKGLIAVGTTSTRSLESLYWLGVKLLSAESCLPHELELKQWDHESLPQDISLSMSLDELLTWCEHHQLEEIHFPTSLMIVPGYRFRTIRGLLTNFHMPGSTLLMLIAALIGEDWKKVYKYALEKNFRFLSYGDSSLLIPQ